MKKQRVENFLNKKTESKKNAILLNKMNLYNRL